MNDVIQVLSLWRDRAIGESGLWRCLLGYENWLLPISPDFDADPFDRFTLPQANLIPDPASGSRFALFSGADEVEAFTRQPYGSDGLGYANPTGWEVFSADLAGITAIVIDPASPHELVVPASQFPALKELADAMEVEEVWQRLRQGTDEPGDLHLAAHFPRYYMAAIESDEGYVRITVPHDDGGEFLPIFTHQDALDLGVADIRVSFPTEPIKTVEISGERMFPALLGEDVDGLVFNFMGPPQPIAFRHGVIELLLEELASPTSGETSPSHDP